MEEFKKLILELLTSHNEEDLLTPEQLDHVATFFHKHFRSPTKSIQIREYQYYNESDTIKKLMDCCPELSSWS